MVRLLCYAYWIRSKSIDTGRIALGGNRRFFASQVALLIGVSYLFAPIDLVPSSIPVIGHLDEFGFLVGGLVAAHWLMPDEARRSTVSPGSARAPSSTIMPNFFIVGGARCGTTSLFDAIGRHPDVFCCPVKEPNYFATDRNAMPHILDKAKRHGVLLAEGQPSLEILPRVATTLDLQTYLSLFNRWSGQHAVGEASTSYLSSRTAAAEIAKRRSDARIIVVLRHPVERAQSEYLMHAQLGRSMGSLESEEAVHSDPGRNDGIKTAEIIGASLYAPQIRRYLTAFNREQLLFLLFDDVVADTPATLRSIFSHIGVDDTLVQVDLPLTHHNQSRPVRFARLNNILFRSGAREMILHLLPRALRKKLARRYYADTPTTRPAVSIDIFRDDILQTEKLTGLDLATWMDRR